VQIIARPVPFSGSASACLHRHAHAEERRFDPRASRSSRILTIRATAALGTEVETPLFGVRVPVKAHALADPEREPASR